NAATFLSNDEKKAILGIGAGAAAVDDGVLDSEQDATLLEDADHDDDNYPGSKYSDSQPRVPAGNPDGGQWTSEDGEDGDSDNGTFQVAGPEIIPLAIEAVEGLEAAEGAGAVVEGAAVEESVESSAIDKVIQDANPGKISK